MCQQRLNDRVLVRTVGPLLLCASLVCVPGLRARTSQPRLSQQAPLWSAKPKQVGYTLSASINFRPTVGTDRVKIQFLDDQRLALAWLTPDEIPQKPVGPGNNVPSHLHLAILNSRSGQRIASHEWPCSSTGVNLAYTAAGQWLLSSDQTVTLYSSSFDKVRDLPDVRTGGSHTFISPSGRTFLSHVSDSHGEWSTQLRDSATLDVLDSWNDVRVAKAYFTYSDHFILAQTTNPRTLYLKKVGGDWNPYSISLPDSQPPGEIGYLFVNEGTIAGFAGNRLTLETVEGTELFNSTLPEASLYLSPRLMPATSTHGERFAVILGRLRGLSNPNLDLYPVEADDRAVVYSTSKRSAIFNIRVKGISPWLTQPHEVWNVIALSPDGQLLGIVSDQGVRVYVLPPTLESLQ
jgi:hypothetical protein